MKILLIFPPLWDYNLAPMLSLPLLSGMLKEDGHDVEILDINSLFMNFLGNSDFLEYFGNEGIHSQKKFIFNEIFNNLSAFYEKYPNPQSIIKNASNPTDLNNLYPELFSLIYSIFDQYYTNDDKKVFDKWEQEFLLPKISDFKPDLIGFSVYNTPQLNWSLNFAKKIKQNLKSVIVFGGTQITNLKDLIKERPFIFKNTVDAFIYGEGEVAFKLLSRKESFRNIPNLIFQDISGKIILNQKDNTNKKLYKPDFEKQDLYIQNIESKEQYSINNFYKPNYMGIDLNNYFVSTPVLPIESSRGCYWHKCEFCTFMDCIDYKQKNIDDLIEEIKEDVNNLNVNHFFFSDPAIHPEYAREFSKKIIENNLKIYYLTDLRLEKEFDYELLKQMYDSGLRVALWGLESGSDRILKLYNKGTTAENNAKVLKASSDAGIFNWCWTMIQFPTETKDEMNLTKNFLFDNYNFIDYISLHDFTKYTNAPIAKHPQDFGLKTSDFSNLNKNLKSHLTSDLLDYSKKIKQDINQKFKTKMDLYSSNLSCQLIQRAIERP